MNVSTPVRCLALTVMLAAASGSLQAQSKLFVGARNLGMGSTGVAGTTDALAVHFNPAGMAFSSSWDLQLPLITVDAEIDDGDLLSRIDSIGDIFEGTSLSDIQARFDNGTATQNDLERVLETFLYELPALASVTADGTVRGLVGPAFRWKNFGFSASFVGSGGITAEVDLQNGLSLTSVDLNNAIDSTPGGCGGDPACLTLAGELIVSSGTANLQQAQAENIVAAAGSQVIQNMPARDLLNQIVAATAAGDSNVASNQSGALTVGWLAQQYTFSYSHLFYRDRLSVGGNAKLLIGETYVVRKTVADAQDGDDLLADILDRENIETSTDFGIDLGAMYRPNDRWSVGLSGTNLNKPTFDLSLLSGETVELEPLFRAGASYTPFKWFNAELNLDLNEVSSTVTPNLGYQYANLGVEFLAGRWFSGWVGAYNNFARDNQSPTYTAGVGLGVGRFQFGLSGAVSADRLEIQSGEDEKRFPAGAAVAVSLTWRAKKG